MHFTYRWRRAPGWQQVASRTPTPRTAAAFLDKLSLRDRFNRWAAGAASACDRAAAGRAQCQPGARRGAGQRQPCTTAAPPPRAPPLRCRPRSIQLIPAADGFDSTTAQKDTAHLPRIQAELGVPYDEM